MHQDIHLPDFRHPELAAIAGANAYTLPALQWHVHENSLQSEVAQLTRDKDEAQKRCADLQRRQAQFQHESRRKVGVCWHSSITQLTLQALPFGQHCTCSQAGVLSAVGCVLPHKLQFSYLCMLACQCVECPAVAAVSAVRQQKSCESSRRNTKLNKVWCVVNRQHDRVLVRSTCMKTMTPSDTKNMLQHGQNASEQLANLCATGHGG